jgi:peptide deformylase
MAVRPVRIYGDPVLRQRAREVVEFDDSLRALVADMYDTMKAYNGVGLAAPQVGVPQRVFVVDVPREDGERDRFAVINPQLDQRKGRDVLEDVTRAYELRLRWQDEYGKPHERKVDDFLARAIQHEADHLDGVLFTDRLSPLKKQFLRRQLDLLARGELPEGYHPGRGEERI